MPKSIRFWVFLYFVVLDELVSNLAVKKNFTVKNRQIGLVNYSEIVRSLYHGVLESVMTLYKGKLLFNIIWFRW